MKQGKFCPDPKPEKTAKKKPKGINKVSEKRKVENESYKLLRKAFLLKFPRCQVRECKERSTEIHHRKGRTGSLFLDTEHWLAVCSEHHKEIEMRPNWAKEINYSVAKIQKILTSGKKLINNLIHPPHFTFFTSPRMRVKHSCLSDFL